MARALRGDQPLVVAFVDVDHLKAINDTRGHAAGDQFLVDVVDALRSNLRAGDLVVRFGGDEFVCVIPGLGVDEAQARLETVNASLSPSGSVSIGLAKLTPDDEFSTILARADAELYRRRLDQRRAVE